MAVTPRERPELFGTIVMPEVPDLKLDFGRCRLPPYDHQKFAINFMMQQLYPALFDEMGIGKTKQVIDTAQFLFRLGVIDNVIIICPAPVRTVWFHPEYGQLKTHLWESNYSVIEEFHKSEDVWEHQTGGRPLRWLVTNYDWIRNEERYDELRGMANKNTLLVLDESFFVKNYKAKQTRLCLRLRRKCGRVMLLNGTPMSSPSDLYSQGEIMSPTILECKSWFVFRARYGVLGGFKGKQIVEWKNLDDIQRRFAPYVLRRLKKDCMDLPEKLPSVTLTAKLKPNTWRLYKEMQSELVSWLDSATIATASQAAVKMLRLSQITSGILGGVQENPDGPEGFDFGQVPSFISGGPDGGIQWPDKPFEQGVRIIGDEKRQVFLDWLDLQLEKDPAFKVLVWCRFRPELEELMRAVYDRVQHTGQIHGGQKKDERQHALELLDPRTTPSGSVVVGGTPQTGRMGLSLTATCTAVYLSNDFSLITRLQSEDRVHRPGQKYNVSYFDVVAVGPQGQRTIDHKVIESLKAKNDMATWTTNAWRRAITEE